MSCISDVVAQAEDATAGRRATLLLKLQDAQRDLARLTASRNAALERATACRALAAETENYHRRIEHNAASVRHLLSAEADWNAIWELTQTIGSIERALNAGRVVLSAEVCAAVDDTMRAAA